MKKVIVGLALLMIVSSIGVSSVVTFANTNTPEEQVPLDDTLIDTQELTQLVDEMKDNGLLQEAENGILQVTDQYVQEVQHNLGSSYTVTAKDNTLIVTENRLMARGLLGGGETKLVFSDTGIDLYINGTICALLKGGMDITAFVATLIPVPVLNTVVEKIIKISKKVILGKDAGNGVIVSIKMFKGTYIPYFVTIKAQS